MAFEVSIDTKEVIDWVNNQANREIAKRLTLALSKEELVGKTRAEARKITATGELYRSIGGTSDEKSATVYGEDYSDIALEYGRKPGKMPPTRELKQWAAIRLGNENLAYVVARNIAQRGTKKHRTKSPLQVSSVLKQFTEQFLPRQLNKLLDEYTK